jgi:hypothetical protein
MKGLKVQNQRSPNQEVSSTASVKRIFRQITGLILITILGLAGIWFFSGQMLIGGVPSSIIITFLQDRPALKAYFHGERKALHDRLSELGVEERIKDYYRSQIPDEAQLDQHIHQLLYNRTGYVGEAYRVTDQGTLILK